MFSLCFARIVVLLASVTWLADASLSAIHCKPNGCLNLCIKDYVNVLLKILQNGGRPDWVNLNPHVYSMIGFQIGPAQVTFKNIHLFVSSMSVTEADFNQNNELTLNFHMQLLIHDSEYEVAAVIKNKHVKARGHAVLTLENYQFLYKTKVFSKIINGKKVFQLERGKAILSADNALVGLVDIISLGKPLTFAEELILRKLFADSGKLYLKAIPEIPELFVQSVGNKVLMELKL